jgi:histidine triad (HIT) family protein
VGCIRLRETIFRLARERWLGRLLRYGLRYMNFAIPVKRLRETPTLLAFHHPSPAYPVHILLLPKRAYPSLLDLPAADCAFLRDLFVTVQSLVRELGLVEGGYRLIVNGGAYQDAPVLHFHLVSGPAKKGGV